MVCIIFNGNHYLLLGYYKLLNIWEIYMNAVSEITQL